jgi:diacylglycerol O-acyltransferase / wax synthase
MVSFPVRAEDAVFLHAQTVRCPQQVGAVVMLNGPGVDLAGLRSSVAARVGQLPQLRRRLIPPRSRWARPRWVIDAFVDVGARVTEVTADAGTLTSLEQVVGQYFAEPVDPCAAAWQLLLVQAGFGGPSAIVVKAHHALGDSFALITALSGLFDPQPWDPTGWGGKGFLPRSGPRSKRRTSRRNTAVTALRVARGLTGLALARPPAPIGMAGGVADGRREFTAISLDAKTAATRARLLRAGVADLVLAVAADAIGQLMTARGQSTVGLTARAMVPRSLRVAGPGPKRRVARSKQAPVSGPENRTAGILLDLPIGPMSLAERVAAVRTVRRARLRRGDADASAFVLRAMNVLPSPLQRVIARTAFTSRRFSLIVSVFPGTRQPRQLLGAQVTDVFPVLALADGVGLALGAMTWGQSLSIGIMADPALIPDAALLAAGIRDAFAADYSG